MQKGVLRGRVTGRRWGGQSPRIHPGSAPRPFRQMVCTGCLALGSARHEHSLGTAALCNAQHRVGVPSRSCPTASKEDVLSLLPCAPSCEVPGRSHIQGMGESRGNSPASHCFGGCIPSVCGIINALLEERRVFFQHLTSRPLKVTAG